MSAAELFARDTAKGILALRGWGSLKLAPKEVVADVFATMGRHDGLYLAGYKAGTPLATAERIQNAEWDGCSL